MLFSTAAFLIQTNFEMFSQFMMVFSLVIAAVTIGYAIGRKK